MSNRVSIWAALPLAPATAQTLYAGAGVGPTPVLEGAGGNRNWFGMVGYRDRHALGGRLSGAETASRLWLLRAQLRRLIFVFVEARLQVIPGSPASGPRAIVPITFGIGVGQ
jgi:hypothetical protein